MNGAALQADFFTKTASSAASHRILDDVCRVCDAQSAALWLISEDGNRLVGVASIGPARGIIEGLEVPAMGSLIGMVASSGIGLCFGPEDPYNRSVDAQTGISTQAMVAVPFQVDGQVIGVLSAVNPKNRPTFGRADLEEVSWRVYVLGLVISDLAKKQL